MARLSSRGRRDLSEREPFAGEVSVLILRIVQNWRANGQYGRIAT